MGNHKKKTITMLWHQAVPTKLRTETKATLFQQVNGSPESKLRTGTKTTLQQVNNSPEIWQYFMKPLLYPVGFLLFKLSDLNHTPKHLRFPDCWGVSFKSDNANSRDPAGSDRCFIRWPPKTNSKINQLKAYNFDLKYHVDIETVPKDQFYH